jgi:uncharacterized protein DUF3108
MRAQTLRQRDLTAAAIGRPMAYAAAISLFLTAAAAAQSTASATVETVPVATTIARAPVPFEVGEQLTYRATFGKLPAGTARMRVEGIEVVRGRPAYHVVFTIDGGVPFFRVHDRYESWIDVQTLSSLRHRQQVSEGRYKRTTSYEIYPELAAYKKNDDSLTASVQNPLDDGSFIYAVRALALQVGETRRDDRYFRPDRNPVVLTGVRRDTISVAAGRFATVVVAPSIRTKGMFAEDGEAQVWFSDDARRYPVQLKSRFGGFSLTLALQSVTTAETVIASTAP